MRAVATILFFFVLNVSTSLLADVPSPTACDAKGVGDACTQGTKSGLCSQTGPTGLLCLAKCINGAAPGDACADNSTCADLTEGKGGLVCVDGNIVISTPNTKSVTTVTTTSGCNALGARSSVWVSLGSLLLGLFLVRRLSRA